MRCSETEGSSRRGYATAPVSVLHPRSSVFMASEGTETDMTDLLALNPDELLSTTRAVRKRLDLDRPVPLEVVREALSVALQAPSGSNSQTWHWIVLTDADLRARVAEFYKRSYVPYRAAKPKLETAAQERLAA